MPKPSFLKDQYGSAPPGSLSEQRALQAQVLSLQEILQLCELINENGVRDSSNESPEVSLQFGELFEVRYLCFDNKFAHNLYVVFKNF